MKLRNQSCQLIPGHCITSLVHIIKSNNKRRRQKQPQQENKRVILQLEDNCQLTM